MTPIDYTNVIQYSFRITEQCNRDCSYCHYHSDLEYNTDDIISIIDKTYKYAKNLNRIPLYYFHGGEPTMHKDFIYIMKYIRTNYSDSIIELQTNFDNQNIVIDNIDYFDYINISFHKSTLKESNKRVLLIMKNKKLKDKIINIDLILHDNIKVIKFLRSFFNSQNIKSEITYSFFEAEDNESELGDIKLTEGEIIKNDYFKGKYKVNKNFICDTSYYVIINGNGDMYKCSNALTQKHISGNLLKNYYDLENVLSKSVCPYSYCGYELDYLNLFIKGNNVD